MAAVRLGEDGEGDPVIAGVQEGDLVIHRAGSASPAALEVQTPTRKVKPADAPSLTGHDVRELVTRKGAVPRRDEAVEPIHETGLVPRAAPTQSPDRVVAIAMHPGSAGQAADGSRSDDVANPSGGGAVGSADHR